MMEANKFLMWFGIFLIWLLGGLLWANGYEIIGGVLGLLIPGMIVTGIMINKVIKKKAHNSPNASEVSK